MDTFLSLCPRSIWKTIIYDKIFIFFCRFMCWTSSTRKDLFLRNWFICYQFNDPIFSIFKHSDVLLSLMSVTFEIPRNKKLLILPIISEQFNENHICLRTLTMSGNFVVVRRYSKKFNIKSITHSCFFNFSWAEISAHSYQYER